MCGNDIFIIKDNENYNNCNDNYSNDKNSNDDQKGKIIKKSSAS